MTKTTLRISLQFYQVDQTPDKIKHQAAKQITIRPQQTNTCDEKKKHPGFYQSRQPS